jgi:DNA-binding transcriptional LysR family regulator
MTSGPVRLDLNKLSVFLEAVRRGSYTAAARHLHLTQSAVSHALRKLQDSAGRPLVERGGKRLLLTSEGQYLYEVCERVFAELETAERQFALQQGGLSEQVTIGATVEFGGTVLVPKLRALAEAAPWLHLDFRLLGDLDRPLLSDEVDLVVDCVPHPHPSVLRTRLFREKYVVVAAPGLLEANPVRTPKDLDRLPVLSMDGAGAWWHKLQRALAAERRPNLGLVVEINQIRAMVNAAVEGYGAALLPKYAVLHELGEGSLTVLFPRLRMMEDWFCVYQKRTRALRRTNRTVTDFLLKMDVREFGDAIESGER